MSVYLAVNENKEFRIFIHWGIPKRVKKPILIKSKIPEDNFYGKEYYPDIPSGEYENVWFIDSVFNPYGSIIDKYYLSEELQKMTWDDEPINLTKNLKNDNSNVYSFEII